MASNPTDVQQGNNSLSGGFFEEVKAICSGKMHQTKIEIDKNTKNFRFLKMKFLCTFRKTWWLRKLKTFNKEQICCLNSTFLMQSSEFLRSFHLWKKKNPQNRTNAFFSRFFAGELQFHVRKKPQNDPKIVEMFWQLFDKLVNFY